MGIDWFTFAAQILNFVILVFLLKRFLYRPVLDAIAAREERIRERLDEARRMREAAEEERRTVQAQWADLDARRDGFLRGAEQEAEERRRELAEDVRTHARKAREDWSASIRRQRETFLDEFRRRIERETYALTARVLRDLADADLEDRVVGVFLDRVGALPEEDRAEFLTALDESAGRIGVRSAFQVAPARRQQIERAVAEWAGRDVETHFQIDPDLALGIEMRAGDRKVGWSVGSYLADLQSDAARHLEAITE